MRRLTMVGWMLAVMVVAMLAVGCGSPTGTGDQNDDLFLSLVSGDEQTFIGTQYLPDTLVVRVTDGNGNPVEGVSVRWAVDSTEIWNPAPALCCQWKTFGVIDLNGLPETTDANGMAVALWQVGNVARRVDGSNTQTARAMVLDENGEVVDEFVFTAEVYHDPYFATNRVSGDTIRANGSSVTISDFVRVWIVASESTPDREGMEFEWMSDVPFEVIGTPGCVVDGLVVTDAANGQTCTVTIKPALDLAVDDRGPDVIFKNGNPIFPVDF